MAQPQEEGVQLATDYRLVAASIISGTGTVTDVRLILNEINIYEDMFSPVITGNIILHDSNDLINKLPITGFEYLSIEFEKPSSSQKYSKVFRIYKLTDRQRINAQNEMFVLHFCSEELIINESCRVSKTYQDKTIDSIVRDIALNYLKVDPKKIPTSQIKPTVGTHSIVIPNWHPFFAISWLSRIAMHFLYSSPSYVFFEDRDGFHFTPLELLSQQEPIRDVLISPRNLGFETDKSESDLETSRKTVYELDMPCGFDIVQNISSGMYSGSVITVDPIRQRIGTTKLSSSEMFRRTKHLNDKNMASDLISRRGVTLENEFNSFLRMYPTTLGHDKLGYGNILGKTSPNKVEQWMIQRNMYLSLLHSSRVNISMPGDTEFRVGQVLNAKFPSFVMPDKTEKPLDELYSGKYFISSLRHSLNRRTHMCYLQLARESTQSAYPKSLNALELIKAAIGL